MTAWYGFGQEYSPQLQQALLQNPILSVLAHPPLPLTAPPFTHERQTLSTSKVRPPQQPFSFVTSIPVGSPDLDPVSASGLQQQVPLIKPPPLKVGDTVALIAPAGAVDYNKLAIAMPWLKQAGLNPVLYAAPQPSHMSQDYLSAPDQTRLQDFYTAISDPKVKAILLVRGGYGSARLLNQIHWPWVKAMVTQYPKAIVGFSDASALINALNQRTGLVTFHGPMLNTNFINPNHYTMGELWQRLMNPGATIISPHEWVGYQAFRPGFAQGRLVGGNLTVLASLCGTPFQPKTDGGLLFLEDVGEEVDNIYRLDRLWQQLKMAGMFNNISGLILGQFTGTETDKSPYKQAKVKQLLYDLCRETFNDRIPIGYNYSIGHGPYNTTLPIGTLAEFDADSGQVRLLESSLAASLPQTMA